MDADTATLLRTSLAKVLSEDTDRPLADRLAELGWDEVVSDDAPTALQALFETRGVTLSGADALGPTLAWSIAGSVGRPGLAAAAVVWPATLHPDRLSSRLEGDRLVVDGITAAADLRPSIVVTAVVGAAPGPALAVIPAGSGWSRLALSGTDPAMALSRVALTVPAAECQWIEGDQAGAAWETATALARWAVAAELTAIGRQVIARAVEYTGQRHQYGRAIGTFQALQHRLAAAHVTVVGAANVVEEAARSASPWVAVVAKALAGRAAEQACTQAQQSYGAIGFTWEHEFHRYLRRTYVLDWLFGDWRTLEREIGARLLETGEVPTIGSL